MSLDQIAYWLWVLILGGLVVVGFLRWWAWRDDRAQARARAAREAARRRPRSPR